ncbi:hypothetical protein SLS60_000274 [Paraconiothyrium brasiliense]|uniref:Septin-type G domain-containing protein n=1 Tax=Paraconiothyrium brasiliense TaxID=300254 RepID=A0ABR3S5R7_9PLEO
MSPLNTDSRSPIPPSAIPSTPTSASLQSFKLSDEEMGSDGVASQAVASGGEEEDMTVNESGSFPQLVMPSIQMPSRRPFTAKGKAMGKLKVLVAGRTGIGKTSLIRSIVQLCEDIVHVDPLSPKNSLSQSSPSKSKSRKRKVDASGNDISEDIEFMQRLSTLTNLIPVIAKSDTLSANELLTIKTSILARLQTSSIKPFFFGNGVDDALLAVQELSLEQSSPASSDDKPAIEPKEYPFPVATHPYAVSSTLGPDTDTMDASLLMSPDYVQPLLPSELATLVNRVFDPDSIAWLRHSAAKKFLAWRRRTRLPGDSFILQSLQQQTLRRGSASTSASVGLNGAAPNTSAASSIFTPVSPSGVLVPQAGSPFYASNLHSPFPASSPSLAHTQPETLDNLPDFSLTRYQNAAQGEQRLAEVRLAKWATDLQRSLRNEKDRYEELQRTERAKWLLERVGEEVASGNIVASPGGSPRADWAVVKRPTTKEARASTGIPMYGRSANVDSRDPLGLCDFSDEVRRRGFVLVKVLGGVSVLGAVMVTVVRICGWETMLPEGGVWRWITGQTE